VVVRTRARLIVTVAVLAVVVLGGTTYAFVRHLFLTRQGGEEYDHAIELQKSSGVLSGFLVQSIPFLSKASGIGLQPGDIITKYNDALVTNARTYRAAIDRNLADGVESITLTVVRHGKPIQMTAPPGVLGFNGQNWTYFSDTIAELVASNRREEAASIAAKIDPATLAAEDVILARILVLPENDPAQDIRRQELVSHMVTLVSEKNFGSLAEKCLMADRYKAAQIFLRKAIEADPNDTRLRMRYLFALAKLNNVEEFEEGVAFCNKYASESVPARPYDIDALRAYVLVGNRDEAQASAIVQKWRSDSEAQEWVAEYWVGVPNASDVVDTWNRLMK